MNARFFKSTRTVRSHELLGDSVSDKLHYYATVTREPYHHQGRSSDLIVSGKLFSDMRQPPLDSATDRVMMCGNPHMLRDLKALLTALGFAEGSSGYPRDFVIEKAFVER